MFNIPVSVLAGNIFVVTAVRSVAAPPPPKLISLPPGVTSSPMRRSPSVSSYQIVPYGPTHWLDCTVIILPDSILRIGIGRVL